MLEIMLGFGTEREMQIQNRELCFIKDGSVFQPVLAEDGQKILESRVFNDPLGEVT